MRPLPLLLALTALTALTACGPAKLVVPGDDVYIDTGLTGSSEEADTDTDTDTDTDSDADTDTDTDTDADTDADADADADTDADTDTSGLWSGSAAVEVYWPAWSWGDACEGAANLSIDAGGEIEGKLGCALKEANIDLDVVLSGLLADLSGDAEVLLNGGVRTDDTTWSGRMVGSSGKLRGELSGTMSAYGDDMVYTVSFDVEQ